ncbi:2-phosphosulfolactate phosphatase [Nocardioides sp. TF02-7]|uniref:2-phosphosulfolactate phosphatase n=1 Tax=Nocardioides sp. TF02-7 TaxID=2917724 RepID=UPI001F0534B2|nr:2-phosphosulfolactate phosphatase [Nocardioides sp. TF02-7]UMG94332.1 2-phosphosulfolactate phosphatase [Nocardioides sp. TF02-7]
MLASDPVPRLVLPSPNGSSICAALAAPAGPTVVGASLRTRAAVADWLVPRLQRGAAVAVVPAGERWPDGSLRPSLEDLWGAGAVLDALERRGAAPRPSPEAEHAAASYRRVADRLPDLLAACAGGRELAAMGYADDVAAAAAVDADTVVPLLTDDGFAAASPDGC